MPFDTALQRRLFLIGFGLILAAGIFLRLPASLFVLPDAPLHALAALHPTPGYTGVGFDENLYRSYVNGVIQEGLWNYPDIVDRYIEIQKTLTGSILPPMRFLYIFCAFAWHQIFGTEALAALRNVASLFGILSLLLATAFAWRLKGPAWALGVAAMMAFAPTQLHMTQHALVDGFFAFWALFTLWMLWESLRESRNWRWLLLYLLGLCLMVITKENAAFVYFAVLVLIAANHWMRWGTVTRQLLACTLIGPLLGFVILVFLAGGLETLRTTYQLSVTKNYHLTYAIMTGDGPWHRYLVDLLLVSPVVLLLAIGTAFRLDRTQKPEVFLSLFIAASYLVMCNIKYGMNLRYANMWDMPLRFLALSQIVAWSGMVRRYRALLIAISVAAICAFEFRQYLVLCVQYPLYELVTEGLLRALHILKSP
ncbi:MAG: phospholipid carrier-dependent glycosyltransferase [Chthoniobacterales bacterium]|nr:phospholipid carrier-dependent glycosyltransferase [Chthoniobacterales bacterium]